MKKQTHLTALIMIIFMLATGETYAIEIDAEPNSIETEVDQCTVKGLFYTVQLGVFSKPVQDEAFPKISKPVYCMHREDGLYAYFAGIFDCRFDAMEKRFDLVSKGIRDAYVAVYYNGRQISVADADELIAEHGKDILFNAEKVEDNYTQKPD